MFTNILFYTLLIFIYLQTKFIFSKCSLLSRSKNPLEHVTVTSTTTESSDLSNNVYNYEPYRVHRTLWRPSSRKIATPSQDPSTSTLHNTKTWVSLQHRPQEDSQHRKFHKKFHWHNFEKDEAAWPRLVLTLPSTEKTTTQRKIKRTFASYFPFLNFRSTAITAPDDQKDSGKDDAVSESSISWKSIYVSSGDKFVLPEEDDTYETEDQTQDTEDEMQETEEIIDTITSQARRITAKRQGEIPTTTSPDPNTTTISRDPTTATPYDPIKTTSVYATTTPYDPITTTEDYPTTTPDFCGTTTTTTTTGTANQKPTCPTTTKRPWCYQCGLEKEQDLKTITLNNVDLPSIPTCGQIFDPDKPRYWHLRKKLRKICGKGNNTWDYDLEEVNSTSYKGGCFKRFLDIGNMYEERGCRGYPPLKGHSIASDRMWTLELLLHSVHDGCVSSPSASLVPFSRAISLFARFHVCVCVGKLCNHGNILHANSIILICLSVLSCTYIAYKPFVIS